MKQGSTALVMKQGVNSPWLLTLCFIIMFLLHIITSLLLGKMMNNML